MLRVTVLKARGGGVDALLAYYAGLAQDQQSRGGADEIEEWLDAARRPAGSRAAQ